MSGYQQLTRYDMENYIVVKPVLSGESKITDLAFTT